MGLNPLFQEDFFLNVQNEYHSVSMVEVEPFYIIDIKNILFVHLVPLDNLFQPEQLLSLQAKYQERGLLLVHLWEDVWLSKREQVLSRIRSFCGHNKTLYARKTEIIALDHRQTAAFLDGNHLQGYVKAKYNYGITLNGNLVAVGCFSHVRPMKSKGMAYQSAELVRFATRSGYTIIGGLSKLIKHFLQKVQVNDLMTYADRDWSLGKGYHKLGFRQSDITPPAFLYVDIKTLNRYFPHRLPKEILNAHQAQNILNLDDFILQKGFVKLFNTGNLKYHLYTNND